MTFVAIFECMRLCNLSPRGLTRCWMALTTMMTVVHPRLGGFWLTGKYSWTCQPVDYTNSVDGLK